MKKQCQSSRRTEFAAVCAAIVAAWTGAAHAQTQPVGRAPADPRGAPPFTFVVIGDTRPGKFAYPNDPAAPSIHYLEHILWINRLNPDFSVNVGDFIHGYNTNEPALSIPQWNEFDEATRLCRNPVYMVVGNHDVCDAASAAQYTQRYGPMRYSWDHKTCHFTALDQTVPARGSEALAWLEKDLAGASNATHRFLFLHHPYWSQTSKRSPTNFSWRAAVHPLLKQYGVEAVFGGHEHWYDFEEIDGIRYYTTGGGGADPDRLLGADWPYHFLKVSVPAAGPVRVTVVRQHREFPDTIVPPGLRRTVESVHWSGHIVPWQKKPEVSVALHNFMTNRIEFAVEWLEPDGERSRSVRDAATAASVGPGETRQVRCRLKPRDRNLIARWTIREDGATLLTQETALPCPRTGEYSTDQATAPGLAAHRLDNVVIEHGNWRGSNDCSAVCRVARQADGFAVTVDVTDDLPDYDNAASPWQTDSVELYFDLRPPATRDATRYDKGVFQAVIAPVAATSTTTRILINGKPLDPAKPALTATHVSRPGQGYTIEAFVPWEWLKASQILPGDEFYFSFGVNDLDAGTRKQIQWSGSDRNYADPEGFARLRPAGAGRRKS